MLKPLVRVISAAILIDLLATVQSQADDKRCVPANDTQNLLKKGGGYFYYSYVNTRDLPANSSTRLIYFEAEKLSNTSCGRIQEIGIHDIIIEHSTSLEGTLFTCPSLPSPASDASKADDDGCLGGGAMADPGAERMTAHLAPGHADMNVTTRGRPVQGSRPVYVNTVSGSMTHPLDSNETMTTNPPSQQSVTRSTGHFEEENQDYLTPRLPSSFHTDIVSGQRPGNYEPLNMYRTDAATYTQLTNTGQPPRNAQHECIWNVQDPKYHDRNVAREAYIDIARAMNMTEDEVKKKVRSLRTQYVQKLNQYTSQIKSGAAADDVQLPTWKFFQPLHFLKPFVILKNGRDNLVSFILFCYAAQTILVVLTEQFHFQ
ncbi:hypothetical protein BaRGS_00018606 [Batillaria attramentaria]|uniref:MADF domain-containing protein n=1 Tax=Batillaria attramentaria TaxID=370345 RepID=A0ABD0KS95_9CAEN